MSDIVIRIPTQEEMVQMSRMGEKFWKLTDYSKVISYNQLDVLSALEAIKQQNLLLTAFDSDSNIIAFIGGASCPCYANNNYKIGSEVFFWVEPEYRNSGVGSMLLKAIELKAKENGILYWSMVNIVNIEPEKTSFLYKKLGYELTESTFTKQLEIK